MGCRGGTGTDACVAAPPAMSPWAAAAAHVLTAVSWSVNVAESVAAPVTCMEPWKITPPFESPTPLVWPVLPGLTAGLELAGAFEAGVPELEQAPRPKTT